MNLQSVTLKDRTSGTPVSTVYKPQELINGVGRLVADGPSGAAVGQKVLHIVGRAKKGTGKRRYAEMKLAIPKVVIETINGVSVPRVIDTSYFTVTADVGPLFTTAELENCEGELESALGTNQAFIKAILIGRENVHG